MRTIEQIKKENELYDYDNIVNGYRVKWNKDKREYDISINDALQAVVPVLCDAVDYCTNDLSNFQKEHYKKGIK